MADIKREVNIDGSTVIATLSLSQKRNLANAMKCVEGTKNGCSQGGVAVPAFTVEWEGRSTYR